MEATQSFEFDYELYSGKTIHLQKEGQDYIDIYKYAVILKLQYEKQKDSDGDWQVTLPIKKVDRVTCDVSLIVYYCPNNCSCNNGKRGKFKIRIQDTKVFCQYDKEEEELFPELYAHNLNSTTEEAPPTIIDFVKAIMITKYYFENLKFNKFTNIFNFYDKFDLQSREMACVVFDCPEIELAGQFCTACHEYTTFQLMRCQHYICVPCKALIRNDKCPNCRQHIYHSDNDEEEED
jgi:hypothetical protein